MALTCIAAYDISDDRRRSRVAAVLQAVGDRIQRSVFIVVADPVALAELTARVREIIDPDDDSVYFFRQCGACWAGVTVLGQATVDEAPRYWAIM